MSNATHVIFICYHLNPNRSRKITIAKISNKNLLIMESKPFPVIVKSYARTVIVKSYARTVI